MGHIRKDNHPTLYVTCLCLNFKEYNDIQCLQLRHKVTKPLGAEWTVGSHWKDSEQRLVILQLKELVFKEFSVTSFSRVNVIAHRYHHQCLSIGRFLTSSVRKPAYGRLLIVVTTLLPLVLLIKIFYAGNPLNRLRSVSDTTETVALKKGVHSPHSSCLLSPRDHLHVMGMLGFMLLT